MTRICCNHCNFYVQGASYQILDIYGSEVELKSKQITKTNIGIVNCNSYDDYMMKNPEWSANALISRTSMQIQIV